MAEILYVDNGYVDPLYIQTGVTVDWQNRVIFIPIIALTLIQSSPIIVYEMDLNVLRQTLKDLEDSDLGMVYPDTHRHNTAVDISGITLARVIEFINNYTVTVEDGQYAVNFIGANSNIADVINPNQVSIRIANSAGLIVSNVSITATDLQNITDSVWNEPAANHAVADSFGEYIQNSLLSVQKFLGLK